LKKFMALKFVKYLGSFVGFTALLSVLYACGGPQPGGTSTSANQVFTGNCDPTAAAFASGDGSAGNPYVITTVCHLLSLANNNSYWSKNFVLFNNIDLTGQTYSPFITFSGVFNGNGNSISNWSASQAFFVNNSGAIKNFSLANITMVPLGGARPGALVGTNLASGTITNCSASGSINGLAAPGLDSDLDIYWFVGGLVSINAGTITHSSAAVNVTGMEAVGGLVGTNQGTIQTSFATGTVATTTSGSGQGAGGLVGTHQGGVILNSYATGSVQGQNQVGGLVGYMSATVQDSYSKGVVVGTGSNVGGLIGQVNSGSATSSYWDENTSGKATSAAGTAEITSAMQTQSTFAGWDFSNTWNLAGSYPILR
jgi:hypothetical protein